MLSIEGITVNSGKRQRIEIGDQGLILKVSEPAGTADVVLGEELIFPGFIDIHVHAREDVSHKQDYKEDFTTAGEAAINGGVTAFLEMPNNPVPPVDDASYEAKNSLAKKSPVTVLIYAGIGPETKPLSKKVPYKVFMGPSVGDLFFTTLEDLEKTLERYQGECVSFHCEDPKLLEENKDAVTHILRRPPEAEMKAVDFALMLIKKYKLVGKICHASTLSSIEKIMVAKHGGLNVTVEVTPTHLFFDESMVEGKEKMLQMNPPIRQSKENRIGLIEHLKLGNIDYLATDHAPHTIEEKESGTSGIPHLDTYGPFVSWLMKEHGFTATDIERVCSTNPGNFLNKFQGELYGKIEEGYVGSLTILDMNKPVEVKREILKTKCGWSPFEGLTFPGSVKMTIIKGKIYAK
jgi:dihydroorotase